SDRDRVRSEACGRAAARGKYPALRPRPARGGASRRAREGDRSAGGRAGGGRRAPRGFSRRARIGADRAARAAGALRSGVRAVLAQSASARADDAAAAAQGVRPDARGRGRSAAACAARRRADATADRGAGSGARRNRGRRLTNITRHLRRRDVAVALARVSAAVSEWAGGTRIGAGPADFNRRWSRRLLGQGVIVLLLSDGLDSDVGEGLAVEMERLAK